MISRACLLCAVALLAVACADDDSPYAQCPSTVGRIIGTLQGTPAPGECLGTDAEDAGLAITQDAGDDAGADAGDGGSR
jgi:hypothetical protein